MPDIRELVYGRKSIRQRGEGSIENHNAAFHSSNMSKAKPYTHIVLLKNATKGKKVEAYDGAPWFDEAFR